MAERSTQGSTLLARAADALRERDAALAFQRALESLRDSGVDVHSLAEGQQPVAGGQRRSVTVDAFTVEWEPSPALSSVDDDALAALLSLGLLRLSEAGAHRRTRERLDMLSAASFEGILIHENGVVVDANQRLSELLGYLPEELLGPNTLPRCVASEDLPRVLEYMRTRYEGVYTIWGVRKDGSRFRAELQAKQGALGDRPVRVAAVRDVTERERQTRLLQESEQRFHQLARAVFDVIVASRDGRIVDVDGHTDRLLGYAPEQLVGRQVTDFVVEGERARAREIVREQRLDRYETVLLHCDGTLVPVEITPIHTTLEEAPVRFAGVRDLRTARREQAERAALEQRMAHSQRIESLGVLAGGVAHDFNNLLLGLLGHAELLAERVTGEDERRAVQSIRSAGERAAGLTAQMLAYAGRRDLGERETVDLSTLVAELEGLLRAALSKKARLTLSLTPAAFVSGDRATLSQVVMNLMTNASDALGDRVGNIEVRTLIHGELPVPFRGALEEPSPDGYVEISVKDDGVGMTAATVARAFEPFFTTKGGQGHGLGLAAVHGIVRTHGGAVHVHSSEGAGSCFTVLLPHTRKQAKPPLPEADAAPPRKARVLVIDDEPLVRTFLGRALSNAGFSVSEAGDGASGLASVARDEPDLVLLDMTLPDLDGADILRRIRAEGHTMPIVLASGYLAAEIEGALQPGSFQGFLQKPFRIETLLRTVAKALDDSE